MKLKLVNEVGNIFYDVLVILLGFLFFFSQQISWFVFYFLTLAICLTEPIITLVTHTKHFKDRDPLDLCFAVFHMSFAVLLLLFPTLFARFMHLFFGGWMLVTSFISFVDFRIFKNDHMHGAAWKLIYAFYTLSMGLFMTFGSHVHIKTWILSLFAGLFFIFYGFQSLMDHIRLRMTKGPDNYRSYTVPLLYAAFYPLLVYITIHSMSPEKRTAIIDEKDADLWVYLYIKGTGFEMSGHIDIAYKGTIYSYGAHDPANRKLMGTLGDGVLIVADEKKFLQESIHVDNKSVIGYGIKLTEKQKQHLEERIEHLMNRAYSWSCPAEIKQESKKITPEDDYASRVWKYTNCRFYKFREGKYRTYFVASTNCVLMADDLIRNESLSLIKINGFIVPGTYLVFLNNAYKTKQNHVIARTYYEKNVRE